MSEEQEEKKEAETDAWKPSSDDNGVKTPILSMVMLHITPGIRILNGEDAGQVLSEATEEGVRLFREELRIGDDQIDGVRADFIIIPVDGQNAELALSGTWGAGGPLIYARFSIAAGEGTTENRIGLVGENVTVVPALGAGNVLGVNPATGEHTTVVTGAGAETRYSLDIDGDTEFNAVVGLVYDGDQPVGYSLLRVEGKMSDNVDFYAGASLRGNPQGTEGSAGVSVQGTFGRDLSLRLSGSAVTSVAIIGPEQGKQDVTLAAGAEVNVPIAGGLSQYFSVVSGYTLQVVPARGSELQGASVNLEATSGLAYPLGNDAELRVGGGVLLSDVGTNRQETSPALSIGIKM